MKNLIDKYIYIYIYIPTSKKGGMQVSIPHSMEEVAK